MTKVTVNKKEKTFVVIKLILRNRAITKARIYSSHFDVQQMAQKCQSPNLVFILNLYQIFFWGIVSSILSIY